MTWIGLWHTITYLVHGFNHQVHIMDQIEMPPPLHLVGESGDGVDSGDDGSHLQIDFPGALDIVADAPAPAKRFEQRSKLFENASNCLG